MEERVLPGTTAENPRGCPACGGELGAYDLVCLTCGTKVRHLPPVDITEAEGLLDMASGASEAGDYRGALRYAIKAGQKAEERRSGVTARKVEIGDRLK